MKRMKALQGAKMITEIISGTVAVSVEATNQDDLDAKAIATKLADCGGAHKPTFYEFGGEMKLSLADIGKDVAGDGF
jgi:hypothetical protein